MTSRCSAFVLFPVSVRASSTSTEHYCRQLGETELFGCLCVREVFEVGIHCSQAFGRCLWGTAKRPSKSLLRCKHKRTGKFVRAEVKKSELHRYAQPTCLPALCSHTHFLSTSTYFEQYKKNYLKDGNNHICHCIYKCCLAAHCDRNIALGRYKNKVHS